MYVLILDYIQSTLDQLSAGLFLARDVIYICVCVCMVQFFMVHSDSQTERLTDRHIVLILVINALESMDIQSLVHVKVLPNGDRTYTLRQFIQ